MKKIFYPIIALMLCTSSRKDVLNSGDRECLDENEVWQDANLVNAYLASVSPLFGNWVATIDNNSGQLAGITFPLDAVTVNSTKYKAWDYTTIRRINTGLVKIAESTGLRSEEHTSELQSRENLVCRLLLEKKN